MPIPPILTPTSTNGTTDFYNLTVMPGTARIRSGPLSAIVGYNGAYPGPTIMAKKGRQVQLTVTNSWSGGTSQDPHDISVHNHGHKVAPTSDGHPIDYIHVGGSKTYTYPNDQRASTYWYHDHTMDRTASRVFNGLAGFYIIKDSTEDSLNLPSGMYDVPLMIQDKTMDTGNVLSPGGTVLVVAVNGVSGAHFNVDKHKYRFRILNGSSERVFNLAFTARTFTVIGTDGGLLEHPVRNLSSLSIAPAERYDIVVDFGTSSLGSTDFLKDTSLKNLLEFRITRDPGQDNPAVPDNLSTFQRFTDGEILQAFARSFPNSPIESNPAYLMFGNNGLWILSSHGAYDPNRIDITSKVNTPYVWMLDNTRTGAPHPFHKHLSQFLIGGIFDANGNSVPLDPVLNGWKDTVNVPPGRKMLIVFKNETFTTDAKCSQTPPPVGSGNCLPYVFHCHNLLHEDGRMMLQETVVP
jgi:FtsP/CotA-like multicopper oxidase with cupredoxin domain